MRRREFIAGLAVAWPLVAQAQQAGRSYRIGILAPGPRPSAEDPPWVAFKQGFSELGYVEGAVAKDPQSAFNQRGIGRDPAVEGAVVHLQAPLQEHLLDVTMSGTARHGT